MHVVKNARDRIADDLLLKELAGSMNIFANPSGNSFMMKAEYEKSITYYKRAFSFFEKNAESLTAIVFLNQARVELIKSAHPKNEWALMINRCNASLLQWPSALYYS